MVLLVRKIDELQKNLLNNYVNYITQKSFFSFQCKTLKTEEKCTMQCKQAQRKQQEKSLL